MISSKTDKLTEVYHLIVQFHRNFCGAKEPSCWLFLCFVVVVVAVVGFFKLREEGEKDGFSNYKTCNFVLMDVNLITEIPVLNLVIFELQQQCDSVIYEILAEAEVQDYASHFARHRISWEMLKTMTDKELKEVGEENKQTILYSLDPAEERALERL